MKIYDFDEKFYDYARTWVALHPGLTEQQIEDSYNEMMRGWLNAPAKWLDGVKPVEYFDRYSDPKDLIKLLGEYDKRDFGLPEPLYARVVAVGEPCVEPLMRVAADWTNSDSLRGTAIALLKDIGSDAPRQLFVELVCRCKGEDDEPGNLASEALMAGDSSVVEPLLERYAKAPEYAQGLILEICAGFPGDERVYEYLVDKLNNRPEERGLYAALLGKLGDARAIEALKPFLTAQDIGYLDYIEVRDAIEELGGDPGEDRDFYGDPDFEAMRDM